LQSDETDVSQFDTRFTRQTPVDSPDDSALSESADRVFAVCYRRGWCFTWAFYLVQLLIQTLHLL